MPATKPKSPPPEFKGLPYEPRLMRILVPTRLHRELKAAAAKQGITLAALVESLLRDAFEREAAS